MKYTVKRHQENITLNGYEYLLDETNAILFFLSPELAIEYLNFHNTGTILNTIQEWADDGVFITGVLEVNSSWGDLLVDSSTGTIFTNESYYYDVEDIENPLRNIIRFDLDEWVLYWDELLQDTFDILDLAYWAIKNGEEIYSPADELFRKSIKL